MSKHVYAIMLTVFFLFTVGCNKNKSFSAEDVKVDDTPTPVSTEPLEKGKVADGINQLEKEGKYPVLDRSDTLLGTDSNSNGVRDDIENYINSLEDVKPNQKNALMQLAYSLNYSLTPECPPTEKACLLRAMEKFDMATNCLRAMFDNSTLEHQYFKTLEAFTFNTKKRFDWDMQADETADGMMFMASEEGCDEKFFKK